MGIPYLFDHLGLRIPLKPRDTARADAIRTRRRATFAGIGRRAARRDSFRVYWREPHNRYPVEGPRRARRAVALQMWRRTKGGLA